MKKLLLLAILIAGAFLIGRFFDVIKRKLPKVHIKLSAALLAVVAVIFLLAGFFAGKGFRIPKDMIRRVEQVEMAAAAPAKKTGALFVLCDFESEDELKRWNLVASDITLSDQHVTSGKHSGKFKYTGGVDLSKIAMENFLKRNKKFGDWSGYKYLVFDIYSLEQNSERLILKIRDANDKTFQRDVTVPSKRKHTAKIYLSELRESLDVGKIRQMNLFRWGAKKDASFYVDNVRLVNDDAGQDDDEKKNIEDGELKIEDGKEKITEAGEPANSGTSRELNYLLKPDVEKWRVMKGNPVPTPAVRFCAYVDDPIKLSRVGFPATGGVPFAESELWSAQNVRVTGKDGAPIPCQARPTAYWPDGSIKWLLVDLQTSVDASGQREVFIEYTKEDGKWKVEDGKDKKSPLEITQDENTLTVSTGAMKADMNKKSFDLLGTVCLDSNGDGAFTTDEIVVRPGDMYIGHNNKRFLASLDRDPQVEVEVEGPERVSIRRSGWFVAKDGQKFCKYILRIQAFKGKPYVRLYHTFIYTGYPENMLYDRYEGLKLPKNETIQDIGILLPANLTGGASYSFSADDQLFSQSLTEDVTLLQKNFSQFSILNTQYKPITTGKRSAGWLDLKGDNIGITAAVRYFPEQFPKAFGVTAKNTVMDIKLWPAAAGELDLKTTENAIGPDALARGNAFGLAKTHELALYFHKPELDVKIVDLVARALVTPLRLRPDPEWVVATTVLGGLHPYDPKRFGDAEAGMAELFAWAYRQPRTFGWYGMIDFGDTLTWYRKEAYDKSYDEWGWHPEGRWGWYNCEGAGTHAGALLQYVRTGKSTYFQFGENLARHLMDVDTCHYDTVSNDPRLKGVIDPEVSRVGSTHRHNGDHWGGRNEEATHTNIYGIMLYYYLTGYERALEVAQETGSFFLKEPITYTRHPDIAPQRGIANVLWGEMQLYEATRDPKYKKAADRWARLFVGTQDQDGYWQETYNPLDNVWTGEPANGYMTSYTLPALIQYHIMTRDAAVARAIIKATDYLMATESYKPFYDAAAYSYWLTGDDKYRTFLTTWLNNFIGWQKKDGDDLHRGMVFDKVTYQRPNDFLYSMPFAFGALAHKPKETTVPSARPQASPVKKQERRNIDLDITYAVNAVSSVYKVFPDSAQLLTNPAAVKLALARNEYESAQVVISGANKKLDAVRIEWSDLENRASGERIQKEYIECRIVEYVKTKQPDYDVDRVGFWPDPLSENKPYDVAPSAIQPFWITVYAPADVREGNYEGMITVTPANAKEAVIPVSVRVYDFTLPAAPTFKTAFDLYSGRMRNGYPIKYQEERAQYDERIAKLIDMHHEQMIKFKLAPILNIDLQEAGADKMIARYIKAGMSAFAVGTYGGSNDNNWPKERTQLDSLVGYYGQFAKHLREKGWLDKAYIYTYDEPPFGDERVSEVAAMIHRADPGLKNMICVMEMPDPNEYDDWIKDIDIFTIRNYGFDYDNAKIYRQKGKELWMYVSGPKPPFPNLAIDFPSMAYRILPWMGWKYDVTGLLYWCVNFWEGDPWVNPMNTKWKQNGNGFLFYPGVNEPVPTIRLYVLRDGIEDYEYFITLSKAIERIKDTDPVLADKARQLLKINNSIVGSMATYTKEPGLLLKKRQDIALMIEEINKMHSAGAVVTAAPIETTSADFSSPIEAEDGKAFGDTGQFTFELYRNGTFIIDGQSGYAWQRSDSYRDSAIIRSTEPLPKTYKVSAVIGEIDYELPYVQSASKDPEYKEGPLGENGCYLLSIVDQLPSENYTNDWWHQHRKVCIDVDNTTEMEHPVFMVYFDQNNKLVSYDGSKNDWAYAWRPGLNYLPTKWYGIEIERTTTEYILKVKDEAGRLLKESKVSLVNVWHSGEDYPDYFVIGDPHENYYQGSMKIKLIEIRSEGK